jgi:hypothetical protein
MDVLAAVPKGLSHAGVTFGTTLECGLATTRFAQQRKT